MSEDDDSLFGGRYREWFYATAAAPLRSVKGVALLIGSLPLPAFPGLFLTTWLPPGRYKAEFLAVPVLAAALPLVYGYGFLVYRLPRWAAVAASLAVAAAGTWCAVRYGAEILSFANVADPDIR